MVVGQLVDSALVHLSAETIELQTAINVVAENAVQVAGGRHRVEPGVDAGLAPGLDLASSKSIWEQASFQEFTIAVSPSSYPAMMARISK